MARPERSQRSAAPAQPRGAAGATARRPLAWLLGLPLLLALAWLASNLVDDRPQPRPAVLQIDPTVSASALTQALVALFAAAEPPAGGASPAAAGQAAAPPQLRPDTAPPMGCLRGQDCVAQWLAAMDDGTLAAQLRRQALLAQRCQAAVAPTLQPGAQLDSVFTEPPDIAWRADRDIAPHGRGALQCHQLLIGQALLAATAGDREVALRQLALSDRLARALVLGSRSLISQAISWNLLHRHYHALAAVAQRQPGWAAELLALAPALLAEALMPARWAAAESSYQQVMFDAMPTGCAASSAGWADPGRWSDCLSGQVWLPEANRQTAARQWLALLDRAAAAGPFQPPDAMTAARPGLWQHLHWRNTLGEWLLALGVPAYEPYALRQADVGLHQRALATALTATAERWPAAEFSTRLAATAPPALVERIRLADDGRALLAARWSRSTVDGEPQPPLRVPLPAAP